VDQPDLCDFFVPAVVNAAPCKSPSAPKATAPPTPAIYGKKLETMFTDAHGQFVETRKVRRRLITEIPDADRRKALWANWPATNRSNTLPPAAHSNGTNTARGAFFNPRCSTAAHGEPAESAPAVKLDRHKHLILSPACGILPA